MNTIKNKLASITIAAMLFATAATANNYARAAEDTSKILDLNIIVMEGISLLEGATITIYHHDKPIAIFNTDLSSFQTACVRAKLKRDTYYVAEVTKPGYITKSVIVSTKVPKESLEEDMIDIYRHETTIVLVKKDEVESISNRHNTGNPVGIIYYDVMEAGFAGSLIVTQPKNEETVLAMVERLGY